MNRATAQRTLRSLASDSANVVQGPEIGKRMRQRRITWREVVLTLQRGVLTAEPYLDMKGCWRCEVERFGAGRRIIVAVSICDDMLVAITTFERN